MVSESVTILLLLQENSFKAIDNKEVAVEIFLIYQTFDILNHEILSQKLDHYGVRGTV